MASSGTSRMSKANGRQSSKTGRRNSPNSIGHREILTQRHKDLNVKKSTGGRWTSALEFNKHTVAITNNNVCGCTHCTS